jgi:hypothetical protein
MLTGESSVTRKHFEDLAHALYGAQPIPDPLDPLGASDLFMALMAEWRRTVRAVADLCAGYNGRFDRGRFYRAAHYSEAWQA